MLSERFLFFLMYRSSTTWQYSCFLFLQQFSLFVLAFVMYRELDQKVRMALNRMKQGCATFFVGGPVSDVH